MIYTRVRGGENLTPDNDIFQHVSSVFTSSHPTMSNLTKCYRSALWGEVRVTLPACLDEQRAALRMEPPGTASTARGRCWVH